MKDLNDGGEEAGMAYQFEGYLRSDGTVGTRNYIGVVCSVICSSRVTKEIAENVNDAVPLVHSNGCAQLGDDFTVTKNMLVGMASNPNLYAALLVGLGCETNQISGLLRSIPKNKPLEGIGIQYLAGGKNTINKGMQIAEEWSKKVERKRRIFSITSLSVGVIALDLEDEKLNKVTSIIGKTVDILVENDATVLMGLTETLAPAYLELSKRTDNDEVKNKFLSLKDRLDRKQWKEAYTSKNIRNSYSKKEKARASLELALTGNSKVHNFLYYSEKPAGNGLYFTKASNNLTETLSGMASSGCNIAIVISSRGILTGSLILPCLTVHSSSSTEYFKDLIDYRLTEEEAEVQAEKIIETLLQVGSGQQTSLEKYDLGEFSIPHVGTTF